MKTLREVAIGSTCKVKKLHGEGAVKRRIMDMGITKGVEIKVQKVAPLGDPMEVTVRGYQLSIRKADAEMVEVDPLPREGNPRNSRIINYSKVFTRYDAPFIRRIVTPPFPKAH